MNEERFEGLLKELLVKEQELPVRLSTKRHKVDQFEEVFYVKLVFLISCGLIILEQLAIVRLLFIDLKLFFIVATLMSLLLVAMLWIVILLKKEIFTFITKMLEVKKDESYN